MTITVLHHPSHEEARAVGVHTLLGMSPKRKEQNRPHCDKRTSSNMVTLLRSRTRPIKTTRRAHFAPFFFPVAIPNLGPKMGFLKWVKRVSKAFNAPKTAGLAIDIFAYHLPPPPTWNDHPDTIPLLSPQERGDARPAGINARASRGCQAQGKL